MGLSLHLGAYATDEGRIANWLAANADALARRGVAAPPARQFLQGISQALATRPEGPASPVQEQALLQALGLSGERRHLALSAPGLLGPAAEVIGPAGFYVKDVARRVYGLRLLFPRTKLHFMLAIRRPGSFLPALMARPGMPGPEALLPYLIDDELPWSALVLTLRRQAPAAAVTVWRHEDLPRLWPQVLVALTEGAAEGSAEAAGDAPPLTGELLPIAAAHLSAEARLRAERYLAVNPPGDLERLRRICDAFALRFGRNPRLQAGEPGENAAALPGWASEQIARLDARYDTEWDDIANIAGVRALV